MSLDEKLVVEAKELQINVSRACERGLTEEIRNERERRWKEEHSEAFTEWNAYITENGLPLAKYRQF